jgi:hypothetical protein
MCTTIATLKYTINQLEIRIVAQLRTNEWYQRTETRVRLNCKYGSRNIGRFEENSTVFTKNALSAYGSAMLCEAPDKYICICALAHAPSPE